MNSLLSLALIAIAVSILGMGLVILVYTNSQSDIKALDRDLDEISKEIEAKFNRVEQSLQEIKANQDLQQSQLPELQQENQWLQANMTQLANRTKTLEERLLQTNANGTKLFRSDEKIIWYGQFYQSNRDFDSLEHLASEGAWLDYRELPVRNLMDAKVVVLSSVYAFHEFSPEETGELQQFVESGGRMVIAVDTDFALCYPPSGCGIDEIVRGFGFVFGDSVSSPVVPAGDQLSHPIWNKPHPISSVTSLSDAYIIDILDAQNVKILGRLGQSVEPSAGAIVLNQNPSFSGGEVMGIGLNTFLGVNGDFRMLDNAMNFMLR